MKRGFKECGKCGETKPYKDFRMNRTIVAARCKSCGNVAQRAYRKRKREEIGAANHSGL